MEKARFVIKSFLEANKDVIKNHLWIITENGQEVVLADENNNSGDNSVITLAPFQGFFVEAKEPIKQSLNLTYNTSMMRRHKYDESGDVAEGLTRSNAATLKITATAEGLYLYDNAEGTLTPIEEGTEYEVKKAESSDNSVSFQLGNGVYLMEIHTAGETKKVKFVI